MAVQATLQHFMSLRVWRLAGRKRERNSPGLKWQSHGVAAGEQEVFLNGKGTGQACKSFCTACPHMKTGSSMPWGGGSPLALGPGHHTLQPTLLIFSASLTSEGLRLLQEPEERAVCLSRTLKSHYWQAEFKRHQSGGHEEWVAWWAACSPLSCLYWCPPVRMALHVRRQQLFSGSELSQLSFGLLWGLKVEFLLLQVLRIHLPQPVPVTMSTQHQ